MPLRLMKTILNELVKLKGPTITQHMSLVPLDNNPTIISYAPSQCLCTCYVLLSSTTRPHSHSVTRYVNLLLDNTSSARTHSGRAGGTANSAGGDVVISQARQPALCLFRVNACRVLEKGLCGHDHVLALSACNPCFS